MTNEQNPPSNKKPAARAKTKRVLIIEDDLTLEPILRMTLKSLCPHVKVDWLYSADEFMVKISENDSLEYDLIFTDINLPGINSGFDIWAYLAKHVADIPVVIMSNLTEEEYLVAAGRRILTPWFLTKPVNTPDNTSLIRDLLHLRSRHESL